MPSHNIGIINREALTKYSDLFFTSEILCLLLKISIGSIQVCNYHKKILIV